MHSAEEQAASGGAQSLGVASNSLRNGARTVPRNGCPPTAVWWMLPAVGVFTPSRKSGGARHDSVA